MERYEHDHHILEFTPIPVDVEDPEEELRWTDWSASAGNGVKCRNCGSHVDPDFVRVFEPEHESRPRCCPNCRDLIRLGDGSIRKKRDGHRGQTQVVDDA